MRVEGEVPLNAIAAVMRYFARVMDSAGPALAAATPEPAPAASPASETGVGQQLDLRA